MTTYVTLANFTQQGLHEIKGTVTRVEAWKAAAKKAGAEVKEVLWTQGQYDMVCIVEAADDAAMSVLMLDALKLGNITGQTLRAFTAAEMEKILAKVS